MAAPAAASASASSSSSNVVALCAWLAVFMAVLVQRYSVDPAPLTPALASVTLPTTVATVAPASASSSSSLAATGADTIDDAAWTAPRSAAEFFAPPAHVYDPTNRAVLFFSIPLPGHLNPLLIQGLELARRGWHVFIATTDHRRALVTDFIARHHPTSLNRTTSTAGATTAAFGGAMEFLSIQTCDKPYVTPGTRAAASSAADGADDVPAATDGAWTPDSGIVFDTQGVLSLDGPFWGEQSAEASFPVSVAIIQEALTSLHPCLYRALRDAMLARFAVRPGDASNDAHTGNGRGVLLPPNTVPNWHPAHATVATQRYRFPAWMVTDLFSQAGMDVARQLRVPFSVNNADLLYVLSPTIVPPHDTEPGMFTAKSVHTMADGFAERAVYPLVRVLLMHFLLVPAQEKSLNVARAQNLLPPLDIARHLCGRLVVVNTAFGLEYPRPVPPIVVLSGPMIVEEPLGVGARDTALDWISSGPADVPVVFVSFGTLVALDARQVAALVDGLRHTGPGPAPYRVIWKLKHYSKLLTAEQLAAVDAAAQQKQLLLTQWVPSQLRLLHDSRVRVFLSHCGINSAYESAHYATPMLCIPFFADQIDMAYRVADAGMGLHLSKTNFTGADVRDSLVRLLSTPAFAAHARRTSRLVRQTPGSSGIADLLETVIEHGTDHLQSAEMRFGWVQYYGLDVMATYVLCATALVVVCRTWCCTGARNSSGADATAPPVAPASPTVAAAAAAATAVHHDRRPPHVLAGRATTNGTAASYGGYSPVEPHSPQSPHSPNGVVDGGSGRVYYGNGNGSGAEHVQYR